MSLVNYASLNFPYKRLADIADIAHISVSEFIRIFREPLRAAAHYFLSEYRIHKSVELLSGDGSLTKIADRCGYNQISNYISKFKAVIGCTPAQYRKIANR